MFPDRKVEDTFIWKKAYAIGYAKGYTKSYAEAYEKAYAIGYTKSYAEAYEKAVINLYNNAGYDVEAIAKLLCFDIGFVQNTLAKQLLSSEVEANGSSIC